VIEWLFVDDSKDDRDSFARALSVGESIRVTAIPATEARAALATDALKAAGILMDIDLSNESSTKESGLGLTADIRAAQHRETIPSFPIVRFSYRDKVAANIGRDPSSDDYFDLAIEKDRLSDAGIIPGVQQKLVGVSAIYAAAGESNILALLGLDTDQWETWGNAAFEEQFRVADRTYVRARLIVQALVQPGILISEAYLAIRLGVEPTSNGWDGLREALSGLRYAGVASADFPRWWARGLENWWEELGVGTPLAAATIDIRHQTLTTKFEGLTPLTMPAGSPGDRPWRACALTMEEAGTIFPIDPARAVRFTDRSTTPEWLDPTYAALGPALRHREDPRLDRADIKRLEALLRKG
jgi:hypothetical protein